MVTQESLFVIDSEFAFYGPLAFDVGKFIGNLFLAYYALDGHTTDSHPRDAQQQWLLESALGIWDGFQSGFLTLWNQNAGMGDAYPNALIEHPEEALQAIQTDFMKSLFGEVLGFAGACMIRRTVTIAQISDYTSIADRSVRAACAKRALKLGRRLLIDGNNSLPSIRHVITLVKEIKST